MNPNSNNSLPSVFVSYASADRGRVSHIVDQLGTAGINVWFDRKRIEGGSQWAEEIVRGIQCSDVLLLACSDAAMRSRAVKQEIQLAWTYGLAYLPLVLEATNFPTQLQFFLEGWQWIEATESHRERWLEQVLQALHAIRSRKQVAGNASAPLPAAHSEPTLKGLQALARYTDQIWPVPAERIASGTNRGLIRDLGAPQPERQTAYSLGSRVRLVIESEREGHLSLLDQGTTGATYCLCPSRFAADTLLPRGRTVLPSGMHGFDAFVVTGRPGREHLLAIISDEPLNLDWMPTDPRCPARVVSDADIQVLLQRLQESRPEQWSALATFFDVVG